jgi:hypothetical protein
MRILATGHVEFGVKAASHATSSFGPQKRVVTCTRLELRTLRKAWHVEIEYAALFEPRRRVRGKPSHNGSKDHVGVGSTLNT